MSVAQFDSTTIIHIPKRSNDYEVVSYGLRLRLAHFHASYRGRYWRSGGHSFCDLFVFFFLSFFLS